MEMPLLVWLRILLDVLVCVRWWRALVAVWVCLLVGVAVWVCLLEGVAEEWLAEGCSCLCLLVP